MVIYLKTDMMIQRTAMMASITAAYFLLTANYVPQSNAFTPIKSGIESVQSSVKRFIFGSGKKLKTIIRAHPNRNSLKSMRR